MTELVWEVFLHSLPFTPPDNEGEKISAAKKDILAQTKCAPRILDLVENVFMKLGLLDVGFLARGEWAFVSYSAMLFARSVTATLAGAEGIFFDTSFWTERDNNLRAELLSGMEKMRNKTGVSFPLRINRVAWTIITKGNNVLLCPRELGQRDLDRSSSGGYVLPGGRMNAVDLKGILSREDTAKFLFGLSDSALAITDEQIDRAFRKTLERELTEELAPERQEILEGKDYLIKDFRDLEPYSGVHGASDRRVTAETRIRLFHIRLTHSGVLKLAQGEKAHPEWLWLRRGDLDRETSRGKAFLSAFKNDWNVFNSEDKDRDVDEIFTNKFQSVVLPVSKDEPLLCFTERRPLEINLPDEHCVNLLLFLGWQARGFQCTEENGNERIGWGWVKLNDFYMEAAGRLENSLKPFFRDQDVEPLIFRDGKCRLFMPAGGIYFSPALFEGWLSLDDNKLRLARTSKTLLGLCRWKETIEEFQLTYSVASNLQRLNDGDEDLKEKAHDLLKNASLGSSSVPLVETVRSLGLKSLYASEGGKYRITVPLKR